MYSSRLLSAAIVVGVATGVTVIACGGGGGHGGPDAKVFKDSKTFNDAPNGALAGLGQKCGSGLAACPGNAPDCIGPTGSTQTWCTPICDMNGSGTADGSGNLALSAITPLPSDSTCTGAYTGTVGTPSCSALLMITPALGTTPNQHYTGIKLDCLVQCGTGSGTGPCPPSMTCSNGVCLPN